MFDDCVIMAGGSGTRLWPASSSERPKQFLPLPNQKEKTFFAAALERAFAVTGGEVSRVIIVAGRAHIPHIKKICAACRKDDLRRVVLIPEPEAKNTAAAIACASVFAGHSSNMSRAMLVLTSDHVIEPEAEFVRQSRALEPHIRKGALAVFGIPPRSAETGYGYIEAEVKNGGPDGVFPVISFHEKPGRDKAEKYLRAGNFFWNSGMFAFTTDFILKEFKKNAPRVFVPFEKLRPPDPASYMNGEGVGVLENWTGLDAAYRETEQISFDVAITERCGAVVMLKAAFEWFDVGSWDEYARLAIQDTKNVFSVGSASCFVDSAVPVALCGVEDLIVVVCKGENGAPSAVLVAKKGETQRVKEIASIINAGA
jgi:mannose-1-phosphate guanylyltransferase/mannose-6-phosphate isomerase